METAQADPILAALEALEISTVERIAGLRALVIAGQTPPPIPGAGGLNWLYPVLGRDLSINYPFNHPRSYGRHEGLDLLALLGDSIVSVAAGKVVKIHKWTGGKSGADAYGNWIGVEHREDPYTTFYCHLQGFAGGMVLNREVGRGSVLGMAGSTGNSTAAHLHFMAQHPTEGLKGYVFPNVVDPEPLLRGSIGGLTNQSAIGRLYQVAALFGFQGWAFVERLGWADLAIPKTNRQKPFDLGRLDTKPTAVTMEQWAAVIRALRG